MIGRSTFSRSGTPRSKISCHIVCVISQAGISVRLPNADYAPCRRETQGKFLVTAPRRGYNREKELCSGVWKVCGYPVESEENPMRAADCKPVARALA